MGMASGYSLWQDKKNGQYGDKRILLREIKKDQDKFHAGFTLVSRGIRIILLYLVRG